MWGARRGINHRVSTWQSELATSSKTLFRRHLPYPNYLSCGQQCHKVPSWMSLCALAKPQKVRNRPGGQGRRRANHDSIAAECSLPDVQAKL